MGLEESLQVEAHGKQKRENEDIHFCVCPSTILGAAAACAISTAWETSQGFSIPEHLKSQQVETEHTALLHHNALLHHPPEMLSDPTISKTVLQSTYQPSIL